jgi:hypothetical protein
MMKKLQILALVGLFAITQSITCSQLQSEYDDLDRYNINIQETEIELLPGQPAPADTNGPIVIEEKIVNDYFTSNKVRTLITQETKNGKTIRFTKVSTTKNPTYFTLRNAALATGAVLGTAALAAWSSGMNLDDIQQYFGMGQNIDSEIELEKNQHTEKRLKRKLSDQEKADLRKFGISTKNDKKFNSTDEDRAQAIADYIKKNPNALILQDLLNTYTNNNTPQG